MLIRTLSWRERQPPDLPLEINGASPLAHGLRGYILVSQGALRDVVSGAVGSLWGTGASLAAGTAGRALVGGGDGGATITGLSFVPQVYTHAAVVSLSTGPDTYGGIFSACETDGSQTNTGIQRDNTNVTFVVFQSTADAAPPTGGTYVDFVTANDRPRVLVLRSPNTAAREVFLDGRAYFSGGGAGSAPEALSTGRLVLLGERGASGSNAAAGSYYVHAVWNRALSSTELLEFTDAPYSLLKTPTARSFFLFDPSVGAALDTARPSADVSAGSWTPSTGTDLFAMVNDAGDSTYIRSSSGSASDTCELDFPSMGTPAAGTVTFYIRHRATP
jgi:hypothetical protein